MKKTKRKTAPKLTDSERHGRFVETAQKIGASEDPADFDKAFNKLGIRNSAPAKKK